MAHCGQCGRDVGCGCNLINGSCASCFGKNSSEDKTLQTKKKSNKRIVYTQPQKDPPPNNEFNEILKTQGLSREDKLKRINDILEKARLKL